MSKVIADVYRFGVYPNVDADDEYVWVDLDFVPEKIKEQCRNATHVSETFSDEEYVQNEYFTDDVLERIKQDYIDKIKKIDARELFNIYCTDVDCYEIDENKIFKGHY